MKRLPLTKGALALMDDADYAFILALGRLWQLHSRGYAVCTVSENMGYYRRSKAVYLHNVVMERKLGRPIPRGMEVDHENRDRLDCQRENLRLATYAQNTANRTPRPGATGFTGVALVADSGNFRAYVNQNNRQVAVGVFPTAEMAAHARNVAAKALWGEFAVLNDVPEVELTPITNREAGASGFVGVKAHGSRWMARAKRGGVERYIGLFDTPECAAAARARFLLRSEV